MRELRYIYGMTNLVSEGYSFNDAIKNSNRMDFQNYLRRIASRVREDRRSVVMKSLVVDRDFKYIKVKASNGKIYNIPIQMEAPFDLLNQKERGLNLKYPLIVVSEDGVIEIELYKTANLKYRVYKGEGDYPELLIDNSREGIFNTISSEGIEIIEESNIMKYEKSIQDIDNVVEPDPEKEPMLLFGLSSLRTNQDFWVLNPASRKEGFNLGHWYNTVFQGILKTLPSEAVRMLLKNSLTIDEKNKIFKIKASNGTTYSIPFVISYNEYSKVSDDHRKIRYPVLILTKDGRIFVDSYANVRHTHKVIRDDGSPTELNIFPHRPMGTGAYVNTKGINILPAKLWSDDETGKVKEEKTNSYYLTYMGTLLDEMNDMNTIYTMILDRLRKVVTPETVNNLVQKKGDVIYLNTKKSHTIKPTNKHSFKDVFLLLTVKGTLEIVRSSDIYVNFKTLEGEIINREAFIYGFKEVQLNRKTKMDTSALFINIKDIPRERFKMTHIKRYNVQALVLKQAPNMLMELERFALNLESKGSPLITRQLNIMFEYNMVRVEPYTVSYGEDNAVEFSLDNLPSGMNSIVLVLDPSFILKAITLRDLLNDYTTSANTDLIAKEIRYNKIAVFKRKQGEHVYAAHIPLNKRVEIKDAAGQRILNNVSDGLPHSQGDFVVVNEFTIDGKPDLRGVKALNGYEFIKTYSVKSFSK